MTGRASSSTPLLKRRRTKVVATVGPASSSVEVLGRLVAGGVDVFRLNFSHGDHAAHAAAFAAIKEAAGDRPVGVLGDLCGPKIRVGRFEGGSIELRPGERITVTVRDVVGGPGLIASQYAGLVDDVTPGCRILLADGIYELRVEHVDGTEVVCTVVHGGTLGERKGMNLPDVTVSAPAVTDKDREDARFATELGVDFLALSFVRSHVDVVELRELLGDACPAIIAKIERPEALDAVEDILDHADGIMVARGDLGVELPPEAVPVAQRRLISAALRRGRPCIVATQMLESMIENPRPTRAEVSDVSTAVFAGADAVMLSAETAAGTYPVQAVEVMDRVARRIEAHQFAEWTFHIDAELPTASGVEAAVAEAAAQLSRTLRVRAIVVVTGTGASAQAVASARPASPVVAASQSPTTCRRLALVWGVVPVLVDDTQLLDPRGLARRLALDLDLADPGQLLLTVSGVSSDSAAAAPTIAVLRV